MHKASKITEAELYVMKALWRNSPLTASEIIDELKEETEWNPKTIHTLISRLVSKGVVEVRKNQQPHRYIPLVTEYEYRCVQTESFVNQVYNGSIHHLVVNFIKEERLTKEELDELKSLLDGYEGRGD